MPCAAGPSLPAARLERRAVEPVVGDKPNLGSDSRSWRVFERRRFGWPG